MIDALAKALLQLVKTVGRLSRALSARIDTLRSQVLQLEERVKTLEERIT